MLAGRIKKKETAWEPLTAASISLKDLASLWYQIIFGVRIYRVCGDAIYKIVRKGSYKKKKVWPGSFVCQVKSLLALCVTHYSRNIYFCDVPFGLV